VTARTSDRGVSSRQEKRRRRAGSRKPTVAVLGLGLIGGSVAQGLTRAGYPVVGFDRPLVGRRARRAGAVLLAVGTPHEAAARADVVVLAATPEANLRILGALSRVARGKIVTDVGSVKGPISREASRLGFRRFVGGHPMAGSERSGFTSSRADLFRGRPWILCPAKGLGKHALGIVQGLVRSLGSRPVVLSVAEHDRTVAFLSHLPQMVAQALLETARSDTVARRHLKLAGPGFLDMTRLARSPTALWTQIFRQNTPQMARAVRALERALQRAWKRARKSRQRAS